METPQQQQYEYQQQQQQYETQNNTTSSQTQSYDPNSYYANYPQNYVTNPDYSSSSYYYPSHYSSYQTPLDPNSNSISNSNSIHPPGVLPDPQHSHHLYYQSHAYYQPAQPVYGGGGSQGGRSTRGSGRGTFSRHGRGRGGGRGKHVTSQTSASAATNVEATPSKPPLQMLWCELCRVDCNTQEILEQHKNGKKHQKNLKAFEQAQNLNNQISITQPQPEGSEAPQAAPVAQPSEEGVRSDPSGGRGGLKRKMKSGRGGKWVRGPDGSKRLVVEPLKPKQLVHFLCELCNVKCESQVVYDSHIAGKKHLAHLKRYQGHQQAFGENVDALYPTIPTLLQPTLINSQVNQQVPQDAQALAAALLSQQDVPDPQGAQAAVAQLLSEHGVHDAQTLVVQLIPYLLTQAQATGSVPVPVAGLGMDAPLYPLTQVPVTSNEHAGQNVDQNSDQNGELKTEQEKLASDGGAEGGVEASDKPGDGSVGAE